MITSSRSPRSTVSGRMAFCFLSCLRNRARRHANTAGGFAPIRRGVGSFVGIAQHLATLRHLVYRGRVGGHGQLSRWPFFGAASPQWQAFALAQSQAPEEDRRLLREVRTDDDHLGPLCSHRPDLRPLRCWRGTNELRQVPALQHYRRRALGLQHDAGGYYLGNNQIVRENFEYVVLGIVFVSVLPMVFEFIRHRFFAAKAAEAEIKA